MSKLMTAKEFGREATEAWKDGGQQAFDNVLAVCREAHKNPNLLDEFAHLSGDLEYHLHREEACAIKIFNFDGTQKKHSTVHDHAGFHSVYYIYKGHMDTIFYREEHPGREPWPGLVKLKEMNLDEGDHMFIEPDEMHSVFGPVPNTVVFTVYNGDLNANERKIYDLNQEVMIRDKSQWKARRAAGAYGSSEEGGVLRKLTEEEIGHEN